MKKTGIITINALSPVSKYRQIVSSVEDAIENGLLKSGDQLPSINAICREWGLSRDTVVNAYGELKSRGIVSSAAGKGFYIESTRIELTRNVFVLFDEFNAFKEDLYNSFLQALGKGAQVDIYFHHFNRKLFDQLIRDASGHYTSYVIMPAKFTDTSPLLKTLPGQVIILDQLPQDCKGIFPAVYQDFENDTYQALMTGRSMLEKYHTFIMVYPGGKEPKGQYLGFLRYCHDTATKNQLVENLENRKIEKGEAYLVIWDRDLVWLSKEMQKKGLIAGKDIGIISYNDTSLKEVVGNGITTISTDFHQMGKQLADFIYDNGTQQIKNPSALIIRNSL